MELNQPILDQILNQIAKGEIAEAFDHALAILKDNFTEEYNNILSYSSRFHRFNKKELTGLLSPNEEHLINKAVDSLIKEILKIKGKVDILIQEQEKNRVLQIQLKEAQDKIDALENQQALLKASNVKYKDQLNNLKEIFAPDSVLSMFLQMLEVNDNGLVINSEGKNISFKGNIIGLKGKRIELN